MPKIKTQILKQCYGDGQLRRWVVFACGDSRDAAEELSDADFVEPDVTETDSSKFRITLQAQSLLKKRPLKN